MQEKKLICFDAPGDHTEACMRVLASEVVDNGYKYVVAATAAGTTGLAAAKALAGLEANLFIVADKEGGMDAIPEQTRNEILSHGATLFAGASVTFSLDNCFGSRLASAGGPSFIIRETMKRLGDGLLRAVEAVMMATDRGLLTEGIEVLAVAGSTSGADTIAVIRATASRRFPEIKILEILAKPRS